MMTKTGLATQVARSKFIASAEPLNGFRHYCPIIREESRLVFHTDPSGLTAEQFRMLRRTIKEDASTGAVLMVTSPGMGDGKTFTSLNLCTCLADSGDPTLLIEMDLRRPTVRTVLGWTSQSPGLEEALAGRVQPKDVVDLVEKLSFHTATVAKVPHDPSHLVHGITTKRFLGWARENFRWVVLDAPPVLPAADVSELQPSTDGVLLVIRAQSTPRELSRRAIEAIGKHLYGVIFNEVTVDFSPYYGQIKQYHRQTEMQQVSANGSKAIAGGRGR
jgi:capsular exopolysaccharide synthesis family protein